ncbi:MAG: response regulator [Pseudomonadota bacterium]
MSSHPPIYNILLIDDEIEEMDVLRRVVSALTDAPIGIDHVFKCSEAVRKLHMCDYDLVLLDNRLSGQISAEFSAPFITSTPSRATFAIISNDVDVPYLRDASLLGADHVVDKANLIAFLRDQVERNIVTHLHPTKTFSRRTAAPN